MLGAPVEVSHVHRTSHLACDGVESCLPALYRLAGTLRCKSKMGNGKTLHLLDHAEGHVASPLSVHRDASQLAEQPSQRTPEQFSLHHAVRLSAHRHIIKV